MLVVGSYPKSETVQKLKDLLRVSQRNLLLLPTAGLEVEEAQTGPALQLPPGQGYTALETPRMETERSAPPREGLQDCVSRAAFPEEWSECTAPHSV